MATDFQLRQVFQKKFYNVIAPKLQDFEGERLKTKEKIKKITLIARLVCIFAIILYALPFSFQAMEGDFEGLIILAIWLGAVLWIIGLVVKSIFAKGFENKVKHQIMPLVCSIFGDLKWNGEMFGDKKIFKQSGLLNRYTTSHFDDCFYGKIATVGLEIFEASFTYTTGSGKNRRTHTEFKGVIIAFEMNKNFSGNTVILPQKEYNTPKNLRRTTLEDVEFEKKFEVYTDDEVEARYLITPSFMERLNNVSKVFCANEIRCAFYRGNFLLGLGTNKDLFSICDIDKPLDDREQFFTMFLQILSVVKLIKHFKLNQKIGL